ncbi:MAG: SMC family ATPase, partial [Chloroflexota bacterium]
TLDFHGLHLACISGANGAGKSTILDAITWALFGHSRSKSDDDVINRQAARDGDSAMVDFSFELEGGTNRVIRRKRVGRSTVLEFQMAVGEGEWKSLSETGVRKTQAAVEALLKMNFYSFINASFLLQGKADEFTTKTANKRKEILADLLGVNVWDHYKVVAAERRKEVQNQVLLVDGRLQEIDEELAEQPAREAALAAAAESLTRITEQLDLHEQILQERRRVEAAIEQQKQTTLSLAKNRQAAELSQADLRQTLSRRQSERDQLQTVLDRSQAIESEYKAWQETKEALEMWQAKADAYNDLQQQMRPHEVQLERERSRLKQRRKELDTQATKVTAMARERLALTRRLEESRGRLDQLSVALASLAEQEGARHEAQKELHKIEAARDLQTQELEQLRSLAKEFEARRQQRKAVVENQNAATEALDAVVAKLAILSEFNQRLPKVLGEKDAIQAEQPRLREKMQQLDRRINNLESQPGGECPLCGQPLSDEHRQDVLGELRAEGKEYGDRYRQNQAQIEALSSEAADLEPKVANQGRLEREQETQQKRLATATARLEEIDKAIKAWTEESEERMQELALALADDSTLSAQSRIVAELATAAESGQKTREEREGLQAEVATIEASLVQIDEATKLWDTGGEEDGVGSQAELARIASRLDDDQISAEDQQALADLSRRAADVGYEPLAHQAIKKKAGELATSEQRHQELVRAQAAVTPLDDGLADLKRRLDEQQATLQETIRQHEESAATLENLTAGVVDMAEIEEKVVSLREQQIEAHRREETAQQGVAVLGELRVQREQLADERREHTQLIRRLQLLEKACGREGVQALLIERALPEIEDDANELLDRLSGGQMQVTFDTQRQLKTSDRLAETLDIRIVDSVGERPYENYSGGEQFRVNFAVRLALSKVLTRRAGARLQTLVIDEGFGSQDPIGRQRLIEAINTVQDDFERILVITHIDEMRDAFPNRIEVEKGTQGSSITVI